MLKTALRLCAVLAAIVLMGLSCRGQLPDKTKLDLAVYPTGLKDAPQIRVLVADKLDSASIFVSGNYKLEVVHLDGTSESGGDAAAVSVTAIPNAKGISLGSSEVRSALIIPKKNTTITLRYASDSGSEEEIAYPNPILIMRAMVMSGTAPVPKLRILAKLNIEEYLTGVLPHEMSANYPAESLRAQAVASRTFALYHMKTRADKDWDVENTIMSQVWKPVPSPDPRVLIAVNSTRGVVVTENNRLFPTFFHSRCGGYTADAGKVFNQKDIRALWGVRCPYCAESGAASEKPWRFTIAKTDLASRLAKKGLMRGRIKNLVLLDKYDQPLTAIGRVYKLDATLESGATQKILASDFRLAVGPGRDALPSTWFSIASSDTHFVFEGEGFGHGVGMCQKGARYCAEAKGWGYRDILARYYPGAKPVRLWGE
jgi:stage II sporulation protein D